MDRKSLFRDIYYTYTDDADKLDIEVTNFLQRTFKKYIDKGYNPREISHIIVLATQMEEVSVLLTNNSKIAKEERNKKGV